MRLELYNSATIKAPERLFDPSRPWTRETLRVRYGLFEHPQLGVTLVDSGYGPRCFGRTAKRTFGLWLYTLIFRAELLPQGQVSQVLADKGLKPEDVQTIIVSHLHADHISELRSFTQARFVGSRDAFEAVGRSGWRGPLLHGSFLELLPDDYASRLDAIEDLPTIDLPHGLGAGRALIDGVLSVVPLEGHAVGHFGLYLHAANALYAVDAHWVLQALHSDQPLVGLPRRIASDVNAAEAALSRLRGFEQAGGTVVLCHEPEASAFDVL